MLIVTCFYVVFFCVLTILLLKSGVMLSVLMLQGFSEYRDRVFVILSP
ncbi:MAG: hypothetical protein ABEI32_06600 [Halothece sp.]